MVECPICPKQADVSVHAAVEITRWMKTGTETLYRCPGAGGKRLDLRRRESPPASRRQTSKGSSPAKPPRSHSPIDVPPPPGVASLPLGTLRLLVVRADNLRLYAELRHQYGDGAEVVLDRRHPEARADSIHGERRQPLTSVQQSMWSQFGYFAVETD
jgi:hypothetical protein